MEAPVWEKFFERARVCRATIGGCESGGYNTYFSWRVLWSFFAIGGAECGACFVFAPHVSSVRGQKVHLASLAFAERLPQSMDVCGQCLVAGRRLVKGRCGSARLCTRECDSAPVFFLAFTCSFHTRGRPSRGNVFASNDGLRRENGDAAAFFAGHERQPRRGLTKSPAGVDWGLNHCVRWCFGVERFSFLLGCWAH
ncbi:hypothetical protein TcCL_NonESM06266 [Trypanosoma cruzi]|nr:hypothetical protein TcCL_NonESM06266 [Trypanosoma cruzi]